MLYPPKNVDNSAIEPLITVIMPVYNGSTWIQLSIQSVVNQTHRNLELLVIDDGSTDGTVEIVKNIHDSRIRLIQQPNGGTASARNNGIMQAHGEYIAFLDADDQWMPNKLATDLSTLRQANHREAMVYSWYYGIDEQGRMLNPSPAHAFEGSVFTPLLEVGNFLIPSMLLLHRNVINKIGLFKTDCFHEDYEFIIRAAQHFPAYPTRQRQVLYRQSASGKARGILANYDRALEEQLKIVDAIAPLLNPGQVDDFRARQFNHLLCQFLMYGHTKNARKILPSVRRNLLCQSLKGKLAWYSVKSGVNLLWMARVGIQLLNRYIRTPFWKRTLA
jgi:glycosyltransferase involved in cell wall biosynthesis